MCCKIFSCKTTGKGKWYDVYLCIYLLTIYLNPASPSLFLFEKEWQFFVCLLWITLDQVRLEWVQGSPEGLVPMQEFGIQMKITRFPLFKSKEREFLCSLGTLQKKSSNCLYDFSYIS